MNPTNKPPSKKSISNIALWIAHRPVWIRLGAFLFILACFWLPFATPIFLTVQDSNAVTILTMALLFGTFLIVTPFWGKWVHRQPNLLQRYGLKTWHKNQVELLVGLNIGLSAVLGLFILFGFFHWLEWQSSPNLLKIIAEGFLSAIGIGFAEELVFRGWILDELERDYQPSVALGLNAAIFALLHFTRPLEVILKTWITFPALLLLGLILGWAKRSRQGRLGLSIGLHSGLVWGYYIINVGQLIQFSGQVPSWVTGIDNNPLAGIMGLLFLSGLAFWVRKMQNHPQKPLNS